ncbi:hypothetical protein DY000_02023973 [Brassica cretica]|uniref:Uncharacterized protein n=1 Tax=Brassica cretica TaxID=69181 RepID=A0ABQ7E5C9_BRACR|nr:hypothetical protein DY000_02023973 [Brassica cretica]
MKSFFTPLSTFFRNFSTITPSIPHSDHHLRSYDEPIQLQKCGNLIFPLYTLSHDSVKTKTEPRKSSFSDSFGAMRRKVSEAFPDSDKKMI